MAQELWIEGICPHCQTPFRFQPIEEDLYNFIEAEEEIWQCGHCDNTFKAYLDFSEEE